MKDRRRFREAFRYYGFVLLAAVLVALLVVAMVNAIRRAEVAENARSQTSAKATRRIDLLNARITMLQAQAVENGQTIGELQADIAALAEQIRQLGGAPVVVAPDPRGSAAGGAVRQSTPATTSTPAPPPPTTTTTAPAAPPTTAAPNPPPSDPAPSDPPLLPVCFVLPIPLVCS